MTKSDWGKMSVKELEAEVRKHNRLYFVEHSPQISDAEFDKLVELLRLKAPKSKVLTELQTDVSSKSERVQHKIPMLSLDKCYDESSLADWSQKFEGDVIASPKIDGMAISLVYDSDGKLERAATRGDGVEGELITPNAKFVANVPKKISEGPLEVRGEIYMSLSSFAGFKGEFMSPRNLAAGAIKQKDVQKTADFKLAFFAYDLVGLELSTEEEKLLRLKKLGFSLVEWKKVSKEKMQSAYEMFLDKRAKFDFELDGVVFKVNEVSEQKRLGRTAHHPRFAIAYKFQGDSGTTTLIDVEWSVSRTGAVTPVAIVEPVELSGAWVRRASLHNIGILHKLGLTKNAKVIMVRRGGVIPHLESVAEAGDKKIEIPKKCPSCGGDVVIEDDFLYCKDPKNCVQSKVGELSHFVKTLDIEGFGEKLLEKLYEEGFVTEPSELFELTKEDLMQVERMGDVLADKLLKNINDRKKISLDVFLQSLGIRELGRHVAKILASFGTLKKIEALSEEELSNINSIGPVIAHEIVSGLKIKRHLIEKLLAHVKVEAVKTVSSSWPYAGKSFLFTGKMISMERSLAQTEVEKRGGLLASTVGKELDYLVVGDGGGAGSKLDKANKLKEKNGKVQIVSESDFLKMLEEKQNAKDRYTS